MKHLCMGCMEPYDDRFDVCPHCGFVKGTPSAEAYHMDPGAVIHNRYLVGRVLGSGGFGITYLGYDMTLEKKVAVKEYFPVEFATRMQNQTMVTVFSGEKQEQFVTGMKKSLDEARRLAEFRQTPGITQIFDFFEENNTAYIVMELLEGETLKEKLKRDGTMTVEDALPIIFGVLGALKTVHAREIVHRDIAPDNIYLLENGEIKLLDFGASRQVTGTHSKSLTVILKPGYAPVEQYQSGGDQGPWTDVYALAATFYKMITGRKPPDSTERWARDTMKEPSKLGVKIDKNTENALMNALHVRPEDRIRSAADFEEALYSQNVVRTQATVEKTDMGRWPLWAKILGALSGVVVAAMVVLMATGVLESPFSMGGGLSRSEGTVWVPNLVNMSQADARDRAEALGLQFEVGGTQASDTVRKGYVLQQTDQRDEKIGPGDTLEAGAVIRVTISSGNGMVALPDLLWMQRDQAMALLEELELIAVNEEEDSGTWAPQGVVTGIRKNGELLALDGDTDVMVEEDAVLTLTVASGGVAGSAGSQAGDPESGGRPEGDSQEGSSGGSAGTVPDITGMDQEEGYEELKEAGFYLEKISWENDRDSQRGQILSQEPAQGQPVPQDRVIRVAVSAGPRKVMLPDVGNMTEAEARALLEGLGLVVADAAGVYSDTVEEGRVISQSVASGEVDEGTEITLEVSLGERPPETTPARSSQPAGNRNQPAGGQQPQQPAAPQQTAAPQQPAAPQQTAAPQTQPAPPPQTQAPASGGSSNPFLDYRNNAINEYQ